MKDLLTRRFTDVRSEIEASDARIFLEDLAAEPRRQLMQGLPLLVARVENIDRVTLRKNETMQRPHWRPVPNGEGETVFADKRQTGAITKRAKALLQGPS